MNERILSLERAAADDLDYIVEVYNSIIPGGEVTADVEPVKPRDWMPWFVNHQKASRPVWILQVDGRRCGWMSFSDYYGRPAYDITAEVSIYLHEDYRGRGLGPDFLRKGLDYIKEHGVRNVLAFIFTANEPSMRLFEDLGFEEWGRLPGACLINGTEKDVSILGIRI
jgi:phosphinothricin acetyltransferase